MMTRIASFCAVVVMVWGAVAWALGPEGHKPPRHKVTSEEKAAFEAAKPVFVKHCARCHTKGGKEAKEKAFKHFNMDKYPFGGHHAHEIGAQIRDAVAGTKGEKPTMPDDDPGAVTGDDLKKVLDWAAAFDRAVPAKTAPRKASEAKAPAQHKH